MVAQLIVKFPAFNKAHIFTYYNINIVRQHNIVLTYNINIIIRIQALRDAFIQTAVSLPL